MRLHGSLNVLNEINVNRRANEGAATYSLTNANITLTKNTHRWHFVTSNTTTYAVCLPSASLLTTGWQITFTVNKTSTAPLKIADATNTIIHTIGIDRSVTFVLTQNASVAGVWKIVTQDPTLQNIRNVMVTANSNTVLVNEDDKVRVQPFVSTISNGFYTGPHGELTGVPDEQLVFFNPTEPYYLTPPTEFPAVTYLYHNLDNTFSYRAYNQDGGTEFPNITTDGYTFYNKALSCNYVYIEGAWVKTPSVIVGKISWTSATVFNIETYPFNYWFWDVVEFSEAFPDQTGNTTKLFSTDGEAPYWADTHILIYSVGDTPPSLPSVGLQYYNIDDYKIHTYLSDGTWDAGTTPLTNRIYVTTSTNGFYAWINSNMVSIGVGGASASVVYWEDVDVYQVSSGADLAYTRVAGTQGSYVEVGVTLYSDANLILVKDIAPANTWVYTGVVS